MSRPRSTLSTLRQSSRQSSRQRLPETLSDNSSTIPPFHHSILPIPLQFPRHHSQSPAMDPRTVTAYDANAASLSVRYATADVSSFHHLLLAQLPPRGRVLEIGCGSGRDAAFLASNGFRVVATDASSAMLDAFRASVPADLTLTDYPDSSPPSTLPPLPPCHPSTLPPFHLATLPPFHSSTLPSSVQLAQASMPLPADHALLADRFDAVVAMAVVMHIPDADLFEFAYQIRQMLHPGGTVILSASEGRPLDADSRDTQGRLFRERPAGELALLFERLGFRLILRE
ncbi:MAG: class I SAM-dependent methyltransferase, partial [Desulfuromonadales bacterium]|nr:class I SAM-dependent methyltransferase [Desulfuromonadales bacterium]